jgi:hypothetical protein
VRLDILTTRMRLDPAGRRRVLLGTLRFLLGMLASPFFLFFAWYYLGSELSGLGAGLRRRQSSGRSSGSSRRTRPSPSVGDCHRLGCARSRGGSAM